MIDRNSDGSPLDISLLRTFLAVHRAGSFTAAGRLLGVSQPTVTAQVRALEEQLGRRLFERLPRGVAATPVADELASRVAGPLDALEAVAGGERAEPVPAAPVHLAGPAEMLCTLALPALAPLVERGLRLRVTMGLADDLLAGLRVGTYDLVCSAIRPRGRALVAEALMDEEFVLVAAPSWARRIDTGRLAVDGPGLLRDVPLVAYAEDLPIVRRYWRLVFGARVGGAAVIVVPDLRGVLAAVMAGAGITVLPRYLCAGELASGVLVPLLEPEEPPINTAFLARRAGPEVLPQVGMVRDALVEAARYW